MTKEATRETNVSPRSLANLRPWKPGQSGNPTGKPRVPKPTLREWQDFALESPGKGAHGQPLPSRDEIVLRTLFMIATDRRHRECVRAIAIWMDRTRGRVAQPVEVTNPDGSMVTASSAVDFVDAIIARAEEKMKAGEDPLAGLEMSEEAVAGATEEPSGGTGGDADPSRTS